MYVRPYESDHSVERGTRFGSSKNNDDHNIIEGITRVKGRKKVRVVKGYPVDPIRYY